MRGLNLLFCMAIWFTIFTGFVFVDESVLVFANEVVEAHGKIKYEDSSYRVISVDDDAEQPSRPQGQINFKWTSSAGHEINNQSGRMEFKDVEPGFYDVTLTVTMHGGGKSNSATNKVCIGSKNYCKNNTEDDPPNNETPTPDDETLDCYIVAYVPGENQTYGKYEDTITFDKNNIFRIQARVEGKACAEYYIGIREHSNPDSLVRLVDTTSNHDFSRANIHEILIVDENKEIHFEPAKKTVVIRGKSDTTTENPVSQPVDLNAVLNVFPLEVCPNSSVKLDSTGSEPRSEIDTYKIQDVKYGKEAEGRITFMPLREEGIHILELTVIGKNGGQHTVKEFVTVLSKDDPSCSVTACFKATLSSPSEVISELEVTQERKNLSEDLGSPLSLEGNVAKEQQLELKLDASCSEGIITSHEWKFNGANKGVDQKPATISLDVDDEGENIVELTVRGDNTFENTVSLPINIHVLKAKFKIDGKEVTGDSIDICSRRERDERGSYEISLEDISEYSSFYDSENITSEKPDWAAIEFIPDESDSNCHDNPPITYPEGKKAKISSLSFGANCSYNVIHTITDSYGISNQKVVRMNLHNDNCGSPMEFEFFRNGEKDDGAVIYSRGDTLAAKLNINLTDDVIDCGSQKNDDGEISERVGAELWNIIYLSGRSFFLFFSLETNESSPGLKNTQQLFRAPFDSLKSFDLFPQGTVVSESEAHVPSGTYVFYALLVKKGEKALVDNFVEASQANDETKFINFDALCTNTELGKPFYIKKGVIVSILEE